MARSLCGGHGHNKRTCFRVTFTPKRLSETNPRSNPGPLYGGGAGASQQSVQWWQWHLRHQQWHPPPYKSLSYLQLFGIAALILLVPFGGCVMSIGAASGKRTTDAKATSTTPASTGVQLRDYNDPPPEDTPPEPAPAPIKARPTPVQATPPPPRGGTRARCCDGTLSPTCGCGGGRGCCSRHGGVCGCD